MQNRDITVKVPCKIKCEKPIGIYNVTWCDIHKYLNKLFSSKKIFNY